MSRRVVTWAIIGLIAVRAVILVAVCVQPGVSTGRGNFSGDIRRFHTIAVEEGVPYRDRAVEYPLLSYGVIRVLAAGNVPSGSRAVAVFSFLCDIAVAGALIYGWSRRAALAYLVAGLAYLVYPIIYLRLDLLSIALALWGLALVRRHRPIGGGALIGISVFTKLWPGLLLPLTWVTRRTRAAYAALGACIVGAGIWVVIGGVDGVRQVVTFRGAQGWQIESVGGALVRLLLPSPVHPESGALRIGTIPGWVRTALTVLLAATILTVLVAMYRGIRSRDEADAEPGVVDGVAPLAMLTAMLVFSPLFSPQYGVWLLPFAAIAWWAGEHEAALWAFITTTMSAFLLSRIAELRNGGPIEMAVVLTRNLAAVVLLGYTVWRVVQWSQARRRRPPIEGPAAVVPVEVGVGHN